MPKDPVASIKRSPALGIWIVIAFISLTVLFGGASRADSLAQVAVRIVALGFGCAALLLTTRASLSRFRLQLSFLCLVAFVMAVQLIPLPPGLWTSLPGRGILAQTALAADVAQPWRPISIDPDATVNSLLGLWPAVAAILVFSLLPRPHWRILPTILVALILLSAVVGLIQLTRQADWLYFYRITNVDNAVGLFANRNHNALFLGFAWPLLAVIHRQSVETHRPELRFGIFIVAVFILVMVIVTGSRAGVLVGAAGMAGGLFIASRRPSALPRFNRRTALIFGGSLLAVCALMTTVILSSRDETVHRLLTSDINGEGRVAILWPTLEMVWNFFPLGAGFGSFPDVYQIFEPTALLKAAYWNHAHNDFVEVVLEGGLAALFLMAAFGVWLVRRGHRLLFGGAQAGFTKIMGLAGLTMLGQILLASVLDYPLRVPTISVIFALTCCWVEIGSRNEKSAMATEHERSRLLAEDVLDGEQALV